MPASPSYAAIFARPPKPPIRSHQRSQLFSELDSGSIPRLVLSPVLKPRRHRRHRCLRTVELPSVSFSITHKQIFALVTSFIFAAPSAILSTTFGTVVIIINRTYAVRILEWRRVHIRPPRTLQFGKE